MGCKDGPGSYSGVPAFLGHCLSLPLQGPQMFTEYQSLGGLALTLWEPAPNLCVLCLAPHSPDPTPHCVAWGASSLQVLSAAWAGGKKGPLGQCHPAWLVCLCSPEVPKGAVGKNRPRWPREPNVL